MMARERLTATHRDLLTAWRTTTNLVGPGPVDVHWDDVGRGTAGLAFDGHWVDLGSGAGFPGLVLAALHPESRWTLVEPRRKRAAFLREVVRASGARGIEVVEDRAERLGTALRYDGVTSRAFAAPVEVAGLASHLLRPGGAWVVFTHADQDPIQLPGWTHEASVRYAWPERPRRVDR
ncbi:MAG: rRNA ((527)-N(7))-methyltransferase RsmG, partial [Pseudomonadota bacterium]